MRETRCKYRQIAASVSVSVAVILFAALGGVGFAQPAIAKKVTICHKGKNTISISVNAWPAHLRHVDTEGPCAAVVAQAAGNEGVGKAKTGKKKQSTESTELLSTGKAKKPKGGKKNDSPSAETGAFGQANVAPATSPKLKKQKPTKSHKGGSASAPGLGGASPSGHGNGQGKGNGNGKGNGKNK